MMPPERETAQPFSLRAEGEPGNRKQRRATATLEVRALREKLKQIQAQARLLVIENARLAGELASIASTEIAEPLPTDERPIAVERNSDQSVTLVFSSCRVASEMERVLREGLKL